MRNLALAIRTSRLKLPLKQALHTAARLGVSGVEIDARTETPPRDFSQTAVRELNKLLSDLRLRVASVRFDTRRGYDVEQDLEARIEATRQAMRFAQQVGCRAVVNHVGGAVADEDESPSPARARLIAVLTDLGAAGTRLGATLLHAAGGEPPAAIARLLDELPDGCLGVDLQPGRVAASGESVSESLRVLGPHTMLVHAVDGARDLAQGRGQDVRLGSGSVDFAEVLGALEEHAYSGWIVVQPTSDGDPVAEAGDAISYLQAIHE